MRSGILRLRSAELHWREIDGELIALDGRRSTYLAANAAGALIWRTLADGATREGLADKLVSAFGIDRARALADIDRYVEQMAEHGLLEP